MKGLRRFGTLSSVTFGGYGNPSTVLKVGSAAEAGAGAEAGREHVVVRLECSALHEADLALVRGLVAGPRSGGQVGGSEGVGVVEKVGAGVKGLERGAHVLVAGLGSGTWASKGTFHERNVFALSKSTSFEAAASLSSVCTALLLSNSVPLKAGDVLVHAGSPGSVGLALAQLASAAKIKLITIVRNGPGVEQSVSLLKEHGAFAVVTEDYARSAAFRRLLSDLPKPRLVLNGLGGRAATDAARLLEEKGTFVSYAGKSVQIPTSLLIERGITVTGFSLQRHLQSVSKASFQQLVSDAEKLNLKLLIEKYPLSKFPAALARHEQPFRNRKVVLLNQQ